MNWELEKRDPQGGGRAQGDHKWQASFLPALGSRVAVCASTPHSNPCGRCGAPAHCQSSTLTHSLTQQILTQLVFRARCWE